MVGVDDVRDLGVVRLARQELAKLSLHALHVDVECEWRPRAAANCRTCVERRERLL